MKRLVDATITEETALNLFKGIHEKDYKFWMKVGAKGNKKYYLPLGDLFGVEAQRNKTYFYNFKYNAKTQVKNFEYATLDNIHFFIRVILYEGDDVFIPIR